MSNDFRITVPRGRILPARRLEEIFSCLSPPTRTDQDALAAFAALRIEARWSGPNDSILFAYDEVHHVPFIGQLNDAQDAASPVDYPELTLSSIRVHRRGDTLLIPLPRELWRPHSFGQCSCPYCKGALAYADTLAVPATAPEKGKCEYTWLVHAPELTHSHERRTGEE
jgi:hypothetical protein